MPIRIACESCSTRLNVPDSLASRKVKCPKCGKPILAVNTAVTPASAIQPPPARGKSSEKKSDPEDRIQTKLDKRAGSETDREEPRPKKKKKRRPKTRSGPSVPTWIWWIGGVAGFFVVALFAIVLGWAMGAKEEAVIYSVAFLIMLPISMVILILSMVISSALAGGIEFGEIHIVIPKALILLLVVNLIGLLPLGGYLALPFWLFGLMFLFNLDFWETRFLLGINWGLNLLVRIFLLAAILSAMQHTDSDRTKDRAPAGTIQQQDEGFELIVPPRR